MLSATDQALVCMLPQSFVGQGYVACVPTWPGFGIWLARELTIGNRVMLSPSRTMHNPIASKSIPHIVLVSGDLENKLQRSICWFPDTIRNLRASLNLIDSVIGETTW